MEYNVGRDVVHELGSRAGFPTKRSLHHHERFAAELKEAEFAEKKCCAQVTKSYVVMCPYEFGFKLHQHP